jgi:hypothetical protein
MRNRWALISCVLIVAVLAGSAQAAPSGDTCKYTVSGTTTTVSVVTGSGIQQFGFAFGAPGLTITNIGISGQNGMYTASKLPANTSGAWISDAPLTGTVSATLTGSGTPTGPVVIVPSAATQSSYFDPVTCSAGTPPLGIVSFTVAAGATYSATAHGWHLVVTIPVAGTVSAKQPLVKTIKVRPRPLVQVKREALASGGKVTLLVTATPRGQAVLNAQHVLRVKLMVTFDAQDGREGHKTISLALRK